MIQVKSYKKNLKTIERILRKYPSSRICVGFSGILVTILEGSARVDRIANEYVRTSSTLLRILHETNELLSKISEVASSSDFKQLRRDYGKMHLVFCRHHDKVTKRLLDFLSRGRS